MKISILHLIFKQRWYICLCYVCLSKFFELSILGYSSQLYDEVRSLFGICFGKHPGYRFKKFIAVNLFYIKFEKIFT